MHKANLLNGLQVCLVELALCLFNYSSQMLHNLLAAFRYYCFWLLFFFLERLLFVLYFFNKTRLFSLGEIGKSFIYGLWMDVSMAAYICALPLLFFIVHLFVPAFGLGKKALRIYSI